MVDFDDDNSARKETKRAQRRARTNNAIKKQVSIAKQHGQVVTQLHRVSKKHAMDCGNTRCGLCSNRHSPTRNGSGQLTIAELSALEAFKHIETVPDTAANEEQFEEAAAA